MNIKLNKYRYFIFFAIIFFLGCTSKSAYKNMNEKLATWHYKGADNKWRKTYLPCNIQLALQRDTLLKNFYLDGVFEENTWTDTVAWEFKTNEYIKKISKKENYNIIFNGVIGTADIYINDTLIFESNNMFLKQEYEISKYLKKGENIILVKFKSFEETKTEANNKSNIELPFNGLEQLRIAQYFTDTIKGTYYMPTGFWKDIILKTWKDAEIKDVYFNLINLDDKETAEIEAKYTIVADKDLTANIVLMNKKNILADKKIKLKKGLNNYAFKFKIKDPILWWTHDLGEPYLYNFASHLYFNKKIISSNNSSFGIRTIDIDTSNNKFQLKLNNIPVTLKIINYQPLSIFNDKLNDENYKFTIKNMVEGNINMIHIWEGGLYDKNMLYKECDKKGILIWHDFMLPYKIFDLNENLEKNIIKEVTTVVKELRKHPAMAFWSGQNNFKEYWDKNTQNINYSKADSIEIRNNNQKIFSNILPNIVKELSNNYYFENFNFSSIANIKEQIPAYPNILTIRQIVSQEYRYINSKTISKYERPPNSTKKIQKNTAIPNDLTGFTYISQLYSAEEYKKQISKYRYNENYTGFISGDYKDYSPVISESAVDYNGNWKGKMYAIKKAYQNLQIKITNQRGWLGVKIKSDYNKDLVVDFYFKLYDFSGDVLWRENIFNKIITANKSLDYFNFNIASQLARIGQKNAVIKIDLYVNNELFTEEYYYFLPDNALKLKTPNKKMKFYKVEEGYIIELTSDYLAKNVFIHTEKEGILTENFFDIIPGETKKVLFKTNSEIYTPESAFKAIDYSQRYEKNLFNF